ncbi:MAG: hypothetical protein ABJN14_03725 [Paracoccaceae bacterium]
MNVPERNWLSDVAVSNLNDEYDLPGGITVYRNIEELSSRTYEWMLEEDGFPTVGFHLNGLGQTIKFEMDGEKVVGSVVDTAKPDLVTLTMWLRYHAENIHEDRLLKSQKKGRLFWTPPTLGKAEAEGVLPDTVEGLLAYIYMHL